MSDTPDEPVTEVQQAPPAEAADVAPTFAAPEPAPAAEPAPPADVSVSPPDGGGGGFTEQHPEALVGGAFVGGAVLALVLKRFGRS